jgi:hypothetical protein
MTCCKVYLEREASVHDELLKVSRHFLKLVSSMTISTLGLSSFEDNNLGK